MTTRTYTVEEAEAGIEDPISWWLKAHNWLIKAVVGRRPVIMNVTIRPKVDAMAVVTMDKFDGLLCCNAGMGGAYIDDDDGTYVGLHLTPKERA